MGSRGGSSRIRAGRSCARRWPHLVKGRTLAMEISPDDAEPYLDRVPYGVAELLRRLGATIVPSRALVSRFAAAEILAQVARDELGRAVREGESGLACSISGRDGVGPPSSPTRHGWASPVRGRRSESSKSGTSCAARVTRRSGPSSRLRPPGGRVLGGAGSLSRRQVRGAERGEHVLGRRWSFAFRRRGKLSPAFRTNDEGPRDKDVSGACAVAHQDAALPLGGYPPRFRFIGQLARFQRVTIGAANRCRAVTLA
jgi:hypothetical protein